MIDKEIIKVASNTEKDLEFAKKLSKKIKNE